MQVYAQVTTLFHAAPDLLDEFKQFLPDTSADAGAASTSMLGQMSASSAGALGGRSGSKRPSATIQKRDEQQSSAKKPKVVGGKSSKIEDKTKVRSPPLLFPRTLTDSVRSQGKRSSKDVKDPRKSGPAPSDGTYSEGGAGNDSSAPYSTHHPHHPSSSYPPSYPLAAYPSSSQAAAVGGAHPAYAYEPPPLPPPPQPLLAPKPAASQHDLAFFARVKAFTLDPATYHEFLKLLNLFTQDLIDLTALVTRAQLFIGQEPALWREFRDIVGWSEGRAVGDPGGRIEIVDGVRVVENVPSLDGPRRSKGDSGKGWKTYGPSYRQLPPSVSSPALPRVRVGWGS